MAAYRRVYGFGHLRADCRGPGSAPERYACFEYGTTLFTFNPILKSKVSLNTAALCLSDYAVVTTTIRLRFDCNSTAFRLFDDLRQDRAAALRPT